MDDTVHMKCVGEKFPSIHNKIYSTRLLLHSSQNVLVGITYRSPYFPFSFSFYDFSHLCNFLSSWLGHVLARGGWKSFDFTPPMNDDVPYYLPKTYDFMAICILSYNGQKENMLKANARLRHVINLVTWLKSRCIGIHIGMTGAFWCKIVLGARSSNLLYGHK